MNTYTKYDRYTLFLKSTHSNASLLYFDDCHLLQDIICYSSSSCHLVKSWTSFHPSCFWRFFNLFVTDTFVLTLYICTFFANPYLHKMSDTIRFSKAKVRIFSTGSAERSRCTAQFAELLRQRREIDPTAGCLFYFIFFLFGRSTSQGDGWQTSAWYFCL